MSWYTIVAPPTLFCASSRAILKAFTIVSLWPLLLPVRGRLETILIVPVSWLATAALGDGAATAEGEAAGEAAGLGLAAAAAEGLAAAAAEGEAAAAAGLVGAGAVVAAGAAVGWAPPPPQAATNSVAATDKEDRRASASGAPRMGPSPSLGRRRLLAGQQCLLAPTQETIQAQ